MSEKESCATSSWSLYQGMQEDQDGKFLVCRRSWTSRDSGATRSLSCMLLAEIGERLSDLGRYTD